MIFSHKQAYESFKDNVTFQAILGYSNIFKYPMSTDF